VTAFTAADWRAAWERGRAAGAADRAAGRRMDEAEWEEHRAAGPPGAFMRGYGAGHNADEAARFRRRRSCRCRSLRSARG